MTLFSAPDDPWSHRTRIVIAEKAIEIDIVDVDPGKYPEDLLDLNPYHTTPTLIDPSNVTELADPLLGSKHKDPFPSDTPSGISDKLPIPASLCCALLKLAGDGSKQ